MKELAMSYCLYPFLKVHIYMLDNYKEINPCEVNIFSNNQ